MNEYTVILLYPETLCDGSDVETYIWAGRASNREQAVTCASEEACYDNDLNPSQHTFPVVAVLRGNPQFV